MKGQTRQILLLMLAGVATAMLYLFSTNEPGQTNDGPTEPAAAAAPARPEQGAATDEGVRARPEPNQPVEEKLLPVEGEGFRAQVSTASGGLARVELQEERYREEDGTPIQLVTTDRPEYHPFRFALGEQDERTLAWQPAQHTDGGVQLSAEADGLQVTRKLEPGTGPYQLWITTRVENRGSAPRTLQPSLSTYHYVPRESEGGGFFAVRSPTLSHGLCDHGDEVERIDREDLLEPHQFSNGIDFAGVENTYFLNAMAPTKPDAQMCRLRSEDRGGTPDEPHGSLFTAKLAYPEVTLAPGQAETYRVLTYVGPKIPAALHQAGHELHQAIDLGFFSSISGGLTWLLREIHDLIGNWGAAIILLTLLVKLVLYPLTEKSFKSMARIRQLKPEMDRINEMYADDREKKGAAMMELYRKHQINPMGGCLPQLLQLPIWFALYTSLSTNVELFRAPFALWWTDLSRPDPYFVLPLALGLLMFAQQKLTPTAMDPAQAKVMLYVMPVMITSFMLFLPAGLCLYMFTNSALSIGQQQLIEKRLGNAQTSSAPESAPPDDRAADGGPNAGSTANATSAARLRVKSKPRKIAPRRSRRG